MRIVYEFLFDSETRGKVLYTDNCEYNCHNDLVRESEYVGCVWTPQPTTLENCDDSGATNDSGTTYIRIRFLYARLQTHLTIATPTYKL